MSQPNSHHFHNGKAARARGEACIAPTDVRLSPESRQQWYDGWNHQDALMRPVPTAEELSQNESFFAGLKESLKATSAVACFRYYCRYCGALHHMDQATCPPAPKCCDWRMAYRGHSIAVPGKSPKGEHQEDAP